MAWNKSLKCQPKPGATNQEIELFVQSVFAPLSEIETQELIDRHHQVVGDLGTFDPPLDPRLWKMPTYPLPDQYLNFLRYSNGGYFEGTNRDLDPLFTTQEVRDYMLGYSILHWMPMTCPIGFNGGGTFYLLDMRLQTRDNDYPVLMADAGNLCFDDAISIADSFQKWIESKLG